MRREGGREGGREGAAHLVLLPQLFIRQVEVLFLLHEILLVRQRKGGRERGREGVSPA
jgi:hypothetical protein